MIVIIGDNCSFPANGFARKGERVIAFLPEDAADEVFIPAVTVARDIQSLMEAVSEGVDLSNPRVVTCKSERSSISDEQFRIIAENVAKTYSIMARSKYTVECQTPLWTRNAIKNLPALSKCNILEDLSLAGAPAIVVGPGPSLQKNIDKLKLAKGKAVIIALQRASRALCDVGVIPDAIIALEAADCVVRHFDGLPAEAFNLLVLEHCVDPALFGLPAKKFIRFEQREGAVDWACYVLGKTTHLVGGGTVASSAVSAAAAWGCSEIALVGMDLAYDGESRYAYDASHRKAETSFMLPGYYGGKVESPGDLMATHNFLQVCAMAHKQIGWFNCTEGGAFIEGMAHIPLGEYLERLNKPVDILGAISRLPAVDGSGARKRAAEIKLKDQKAQAELDRVLSNWRI